MKTLPPHPSKKKLTRSLKIMASTSFVARPFKSIYDKLFPVGYEDEKGFHYESQKRQL
jgi:hypothetical protein